MINYASVFTNVNGTFPNITGKNATGAGATDGTEFIAAFVDDIWGRFQALMNRAGLTPDGVTESISNSQYLEAFEKGFAIGPGYVIQYVKAGTPAANGDRVIILTGQGVLRSSYPLLDAAVYVGDANNAAVAAAGGAFYRADDAAGTTPNTTGAYLILPDCRGRVPRGDDAAASVDPQGASRVLGDLQADAFQGFAIGLLDGTGGSLVSLSSSQVNFRGYSGTDLNYEQKDGGGTSYMQLQNDGTNGTPRTTSETRMANFQTRWGITY